jgi:hypothetical protein
MKLSGPQLFRHFLWTLSREEHKTSSKGLDSLISLILQKFARIYILKSQSRLFCAQMALVSLVVISGPQKIPNFQGPSLPMALEMDFPALKSLLPAAQ